MNTVATVTPLRPRDYSGAQLKLIMNTVASDCSPLEFDLFMEVSKRVGLDPFRRQIYAVVYNKDKPEKRKMSIITGIDGFRAVAARNRDYRPDEEEPRFELRDDLKGPGNPAGIYKCVVKCFKFGPDQAWHPLVGVAYWDEFAPVKEVAEGGYDWVETGEVWEDSGKPKKKKVPKGAVTLKVEGKWATMPHVMLGKCAEAQAIRKGWPEDLSGIYAPEEMERADIEATASETVTQHERDERVRLVGGRQNVAVLWNAGEPLEAVPIGKLTDRCLEFIRKAESPTQLEVWRETNKISLQMFWAEAKSDALAVKAALEKRIQELTQP